MRSRKVLERELLARRWRRGLHALPNPLLHKDVQ
jgi:hypothetical protein